MIKAEKIGHGPKINYRLCNGCGICYKDCPSDVFAWDDARGLPVVEYPDECYHCAACDVGCPEEAISMMTPLHCLLALSIYPEI